MHNVHESNKQIEMLYSSGCGVVSIVLAAFSHPVCVGLAWVIIVYTVYIECHHV